MLLLILGIILFIGLVVIHEFGHFIFARRNGVDVEEFGIGFPPRLYTRKTKGGWLFTINALPLGGFVRMKGEHDTDTEPGTFGAASLWAKTQIMAAGVVMNLITAFVLLTILAVVGMPKLIDNQFTIASDTKVSKSQVLVGYVEPDSPASKAGLKSGDRIISVDTPQKVCLYTTAGVSSTSSCKQTLATASDLTSFTKDNAGKRVVLHISHSGHVATRTATLRAKAAVEASLKTSNPKGYLGVAPTEFVLQRSTYSAPIVAAGLIKQFTVLTVQGLGKAVAGLGSIIAGTVTGDREARRHGQTAASEQVSGPVGIFVILKDGTVLGINFILAIIAIISLTLAIMNILPIPALDGGRLWLTLASRALGKPLTQEREELINGIGFVVLLLLIVVITVVDVKRFF